MPHTLSKKKKASAPPVALWVCVAVLIALAGIYFLTPEFSSSGSAWNYGIFVFLAIALGLILPYLLLKLGFHAAHLYNKKEVEIQLTDLAKDQLQLEESKRRRKKE